MLEKATAVRVRATWRGYVVAVALTTLTLLARHAASGYVVGPTLVLFTIPIALSAYWGGLGPGLLATLLAMCGTAYFLLPPLGSVAISSASELLQEAALLMSGVLISVICMLLHRSRQRKEHIIDELHAGQEALRRALRETVELRAAIDEHAIVATTNPRGEIQFVNDKFCTISQYAREELIGQDHRLINSGHHSSEFIRDLWRTIANGSVWHGDIKNKAKDGSFYWVATTIVPFLNDVGHPVQYVAIRADITERKRAEDALRENELRMRLATEATGVGIWEWNVKTGALRWDSRMFQMYGVPPTDTGLVPYSAWAASLPPDELEAQEAMLRTTVLRGGHSSREFRILRGNELRHIQSVETVQNDEHGQAEWVLGTNLDITERKRAEDALRESETNFRTMANSIPQLAWIANADGAIFWYNQRWYEYTGTTLDGMDGWGWQSVHHPDVLPTVMQRWTTAIACGAPFEMEFPIRGADGTFREFLTRVQPLKDADGRVVQWFGTNTDVDRLKHAEEAVQSLNATLEQRVLDRTAEVEAANKELEAFSYSISHDLRAPLRAMNGFAGMALESLGADIPPSAAHYLDRIRSNGVRMGQLIDDLLAFARLSRQPVRRQVVDMRHLVDGVVQELIALSGPGDLDIRIGVLQECMGDPALLRQVWMNLLSNAIKYSKGRAQAVIEIESTSENAEDTYLVRDNGVGFDMQYARKLFGVFQRLHRADEFEGTGVGLAIVQRVIHRHGGRVWAEAQLDHGATFHFTVPRTSYA